MTDVFDGGLVGAAGFESAAETVIPQGDSDQAGRAPVGTRPNGTGDSDIAAQEPAQRATARPLAIDLYCGLGGWTDGLLAEGYDVIGFDIERHVYGEHRYPGLLVIQDVRTLHGAQFRNARLIVASPPCQAYSYRAMPWKRAKALPPPDNDLFDTCFRIQHEACEEAGRHIPLIVENVKGAQKWVGRARWNWGSFYLWGDVPALMPPTFKSAKGKPYDEGVKQRGSGAAWFDKALDERRKNPDGRKQPGIDLAAVGFNVACAHEFGHMVEGVKIKRSDEDKRLHLGVKRKFASAMIAKIPIPLARHIAATFNGHGDSDSGAQMSAGAERQKAIAIAMLGLLAMLGLGLLGPRQAQRVSLADDPCAFSSVPEAQQ